jgi:hypothetical protein
MLSKIWSLVIGDKSKLAQILNGYYMTALRDIRNSGMNCSLTILFQYGQQRKQCHQQLLIATEPYVPTTLLM